MAESAAKNPSRCKNLAKIFACSRKPESCVDDLIFDFLEEEEEDSLKSSSDASFGFDNSTEIIKEEDENVSNFEENKAFWESREELLKTTLYRTSSVESKIREATTNTLKELNTDGVGCLCPRTIIDGCKNCLQKEICARLKIAGYNCIIRKSKWRSTPEIPSGEHTFVEVLHTTNSKNGEIMKIIIELNLQGEFKMARASEEYNRLINRLPEVYVGKIERLRTLLKILCCASKKCMKERKMHIAPWRKLKYMEAKWLLGTTELKVPLPILRPVEYHEKRQRPRASMLTFDLLDSLPSWHSKAIKVI